MPLADHLAAGTQETFRRTGTDMDSTAGLQDMQFFDRFEHDIGNLAHPVAAIGFYTADIQVRKIIIRTAFLSRDADFGRSRVVVHFDEETGHQFFCLVACQRTVAGPLFVERSQMLVEMAGIHRVPTVQFGDRS